MWVPLREKIDQKTFALFQGINRSPEIAEHTIRTFRAIRRERKMTLSQPPATAYLAYEYAALSLGQDFLEKCFPHVTEIGNFAPTPKRPPPQSLETLKWLLAEGNTYEYFYRLSGAETSRWDDPLALFFSRYKQVRKQSGICTAHGYPGAGNMAEYILCQHPFFKWKRKNRSVDLVYLRQGSGEDCTDCGSGLWQALQSNAQASEKLLTDRPKSGESLGEKDLDDLISHHILARTPLPAAPKMSCFGLELKHFLALQTPTDVKIDDAFAELSAGVAAGNI